MKFTTTVRLFSAAAVASLLLAPAAQADSGFFIGGSIGESDLSDELDLEDDSVAYKAMFGYIFDMPVVDFGVELDYIDFGGASENFGGGDSIDVDVTGLAGFGIAGVDWGLFGIFAKVGFASWDLDARIQALGQTARGSESGSDLAYGIGMRFTFSSAEIRLEYERFDVEEDNFLGSGATVDDSINLITVGAIWRF